MYCSNCGFKLHKSHLFCPHCGAAKPVVSEVKAGHAHGTGRGAVPSIGRRIAVVLYALSYLVLVAVSGLVGYTIYQSFAAPDQKASFVTCKSGNKVSYSQIGIHNPTTDPGHDNLLIDVSCRNLGGNTYTNVMRRGRQDSAWQLGLAVFVGGLVLIEVVKGVLVYLIKGRFPALGTLGRR